jgi:hypothetical protein
MLETTDSNVCRICQQFDEAEHLAVGRPISAKALYIEHHDGACTQLLFNLCEEVGLKKRRDKWYVHIPEPVDTNRDN